MTAMPPEILRSGERSKRWIFGAFGLLPIALGAAFLTVRIHGAAHEKTLLLAYDYLVLVPAVFWYMAGRRGEREVSFGRWSRTVALLAALGFVSSAVFSWERGSAVLLTDEQVYRFQARLLEAGKLADAPPPGITGSPELPPEFRFHHNLITQRGWTGMYPVVWPALLAVGDAAGAAWLVTPLLGAVLILLTAMMGRAAFGPEAGIIGAALIFPTPFFWINASGMMSHTLAACLVAAAAWLAEIGVRKLSRIHFVIAAALIGLCFFVRPFSSIGAGGALAIAIALRAAVLSEPGFTPKWMVRNLAIPIFCVAAITGALILFENWYTTGNAFLFPYAFAARLPMPPEVSFNPRYILAHLPETKNSLIVTAIHASPVLFGLAILALAVRFRKQPGTCLVLVSAFAGSVVFYAFDVVPNIYFGGQRMYFEGMAGVAALAGGGAAWMLRRFRPRAGVLVVCAAAIALTQTTDMFVINGDLRYRMRFTSGFLPHVEALKLDNGIVFLRAVDEAGFTPRNFNPNGGDWRRARKIYLLDPGPERREIVARAFHRSRWVVVAYYAERDAMVIEASGGT